MSGIFTGFIIKVCCHMKFYVIFYKQIQCIYINGFNDYILILYYVHLHNYLNIYKLSCFSAPNEFYKKKGEEEGRLVLH